MKGKQYFDTLLVEGIERVIEKESSKKGSPVRTKTSLQSPRSPGPVRLANYMSEKSQQKREDGKSALLLCLKKASQASEQEFGEPRQGLYQQKLSELKSFIRDHIDTQENFSIFQAMVDNLGKAQQQRRNQIQTRRKGSTLQNIEENSQYFPEKMNQQPKTAGDIVSPSRIRKVISNNIPRPGAILYSAKVIPSHQQKLATDYT